MNSYSEIYLKRTGMVLFCFLLSYSLCGQNDQELISLLKEKFEDFVESYPREEVFVHTDRQEYIAGEELFYSFYLINRHGIKPSDISNIAYIELISNQGNPVIQQRVMANEAKGSGMFILPDSLVTGVYLLRAYTSWMKNFFPSNCFQKEIYVYNLLADDKATITKRPSFNFNKTLKPPARGITLVTDRSEKDSLKMIITADSSFIRGQKMLSIIQTNGNINYTGIHRATGQKLVISIPRTILPEGVNQITLFNEHGLPVAEKLIYTLLPPKDSFTITAKKLYKRRELVELLVNNDSNLPGVFSISVSPGTDRSCGLRNYAEIGTEFGINPEAIFKTRETESISEPFMDSLLVNATSRWINWSVILKGEKPGTRYLRERDRYYISGNVAGNNEGLVFLTSPGKIAWFQYAKPDSTG